MGQLSGRVALVTGSTSGIGLGIACALAAEGADVAMNGFGTDAAITEACQAVEAFGGRITLSRANVREPDEVRQMVADAIATFGKID
ncbi:MAG: SDR family NAD(P)-dependent oxidoreductase, partial [Janthinobacterium lividum]